VITFYDNTGQFVTGGGWIVDPAGGGNAHGNFGFKRPVQQERVAAGADGLRLPRPLQRLWRSTTASRATRSHRSGSCAGTAPPFGPCPLGNATFPAKASLEGKCTIQINRASDGYLLYGDGNATFSATVVDSGSSSGIGSDSYMLKVYDKNSVLYKSVPTTFLSGGNVVIHGAK
jgi:hypothetical protein